MFYRIILNFIFAWYKIFFGGLGESENTDLTD